MVVVGHRQTSTAGVIRPDDDVTQAPVYCHYFSRLVTSSAGQVAARVVYTSQVLATPVFCGLPPAINANIDKKKAIGTELMTFLWCRFGTIRSGTGYWTAPENCADRRLTDCVFPHHTFTKPSTTV